MIMKTENLNLNVNTLDDHVIYKEVCKKIRESNLICLILIGTIPLISGFIVIRLWTYSDILSDPFVIVLTLFGALVTYNFQRWGSRIRQASSVFIHYASVMEENKVKKEQTDPDTDHSDGPRGPFTLLLKRSSHPAIKNGEDRLNIHHVETTIYVCTIFLWLLVPVLKLFLFIGQL